MNRHTCNLHPVSIFLPHHRHTSATTITFPLHPSASRADTLHFGRSIITSKAVAASPCPPASSNSFKSSSSVVLVNSCIATISELERLLRHIIVPASSSPFAFIQEHQSGGGGGGDGSGGGSGGNNSNNDNNSDDDSNNEPNWGLITSLATVTAALSLIAHLYQKKMRENRLLNTSTWPVSIIVPCLNESKNIAATVAYLQSLHPAAAEIIVADGGSVDNTVEIARKAGARVVKSKKRGRGLQMNVGAAAAAGGAANSTKKDSIYLFVHSDSRPPRDAVGRVRTALSDASVVLGGFFTRIETDDDDGGGGGGRLMLFTTFHNFISTYYAPLLFSPVECFRGLKCMFGDQSLFCRSEDFHRVHGYNDALPLMEDADLCVRMHRNGLKSGKAGKEVQLLRGINRTSGRRIKKWGNLKATEIQVRISLAWWRGATPEELWEVYDRLYTDAFR